jgi:DNA polymerase III epsilon subunit-like protein
MNISQMLEESGIPLKEALEALDDFLEDLPVIFHNLPFDMSFLNAACKECGLPLFSNPGRDTLEMARKRVHGVSDYKLGTLARHFNLETGTLHRALSDCRLTALLYEKLKKMDD